MKKKLYLFMLALSAGLTANATFVPVTLSGFNQDCIANGVGNASASTTSAVDQASWALLSADFKVTSSSSAPPTSLPASGTINSAVTTGLSFQLANYTGNNDLVLSAASSTGTLTFGTPMIGDLYVLGFGGNGVATCDILIKFTDNTTQNVTGVTFDDWYYAANPVITAIGRIDRTNNTMENPAADPRLYQRKLTLNTANYGKLISSIQVTKVGATAVLNILAVSICRLPVVSAQPLNMSICENENTSFSVAATNTTTYQWQVNTGSGFTNLSANAIYSGTSTYMLNITNAPGTFNNYTYRCVMTSACGGTLNSAAALLNVTSKVNVTAQTTSLYACVGSPARLNVSHAGNGVSYKWIMNTSTGAYIDVPSVYPYSGCTTPQLDIAYVDNSMNGQAYRCVVYGGCNVDTSDPVVANIYNGPFISTDPDNDTVALYYEASFHAYVTGDISTYTAYWQASFDNGVNYFNINDNNTYRGTKTNVLFVVPPSEGFNGTLYRCIMKSSIPSCSVRDTSEAGMLVLDIPNGINDRFMEKGISVYPNPLAGGELFIRAIEGIKGNTMLTITNTIGTVVYKAGIRLEPNMPVSIPAATLPAGVYNVQLVDEADNRMNTRFVKQ